MTMKKILSFFILMLLPMVAGAYTKIDGIYYNFDTNAKTATVTYYSSGNRYQDNKDAYSGDVIIPAKVNYKGAGYSVTSIGDHAFSWCSEMTSVTIPNSVTSIENSAFSSCRGLTSITIPNSVTIIENSTFSGCIGLTSVTIPNSVTSIENSAFIGCRGLTSITIPNSVMSIGNNAFDFCISLTSITIPNSVTSIGEYAFRDCLGLTSVTISNSVTSIGEGTFYECSGLTSVTIPNSVMSIGECAFQDCSSLTSVTIGNSLTSIGSGGFYGCSSLTSVHISDIAAWCNISFDNYTSNPLYCAHHLYLGEEEIKDLVIPNSVTSIGERAFWECSGLTSVTIPNSVTSIGWDAFGGCSGLTTITIPNSVTSIGGGAFMSCLGLTSVTIPNSVTSIGDGAFSDCRSLTSVTISSGVKSIDSKAFAYCLELTDVYCLAEEVPSTSTNAFQDSNIGNATLHVPAASVDAYKAVRPWKSFKDIVGLTEAVSVRDVSVHPAFITTHGGMLCVEGADDGEQVSVYNAGGTLQGQAACEGGCATVSTNLQPGSIAIVKIGDKAVKVMVK